jgi:tetratricopeptide (TPR) repeat protein
MDHSTSAPEKSLTRSALLTFVGEREKADDMIAHFEKRLEKNEKDRTALFVLSEAYARLKRDPQKSVNYIERLAKVIEDSGETVDVITYAQLASLYVKSKKYQQGAELFEKIAPDDESMAPWHWKEAAATWLKAGDKEKALAAAMNSTKVGPESRADFLNYSWNNTLGDIYLELDKPKLAIPHYENALKATKSKAYLKTTQENLDKAKAKAK